ncbi:MAG TPA: hypothetical protein VFK43_23635, partial [Acidimicrobiales bacterium]|nr:hypothetical protein [Acidimicrobiales bacterium]
MTEPQPVMAQAEQDQLTRKVGRSLLTVAGEGWQRVRAEYRSAGRHIEVDVFVTGPDGVEKPVRPPQEVVEGLGRLRQGMYRPGRGTWLSALYILEPPSSFSAEFEPDVEPRWRRVPPPIGFADELKFFPRADEHIPDWFRQRAGLPPVEGAAGQRPGEPTPPRGVPGSAPTPGGEPSPAQGMPGGQPMAGPSGQPGNEPRQTGEPPATHGGQPTPPPGIPATPFGGQPTPSAPGQPGGEARHSTEPSPGPGGQPTPPPGIPATPFGGQSTPGGPGQHGGGPSAGQGSPFGGQPAGAPFGQREGEPAPPPGIPATPFGQPTPGEPSPPHGDPSGARHTGAPFGQPHGEPTPPPGIPATPFGGQPG